MKCVLIALKDSVRVVTAKADEDFVRARIFGLLLAVPHSATRCAEPIIQITEVAGSCETMATF